MCNYSDFDECFLNLYYQRIVFQCFGAFKTCSAVITQVEMVFCQHRLNLLWKWPQRRYLWHSPFKKSRMRIPVRKLTPELRSQKNSDL